MKRFGLFLPVFFLLITEVILSSNSPQQNFCLGIIKNDVNLVIQSINESDIDINQINPLTNNSPLQDALINFFNQSIKSFKLDYIFAAMLGIIFIPEAISFQRIVRMKVEKKDEYKKNIDTAVNGIGCAAILLGIIKLLKSCFKRSEKVNNAMRILKTVLVQPGLKINAEHVKYCLLNIPEHYSLLKVGTSSIASTIPSPR